MRHQNVGLQMIMDRRAREDAQKIFDEASKDDFVSRQRALFETNSFHTYQNRELKRRARQRAKAAEEAINIRRKKLADLLNSEEEQFSVEICNTIETPAQKRIRLQKELQGYRERKKREHDEDVERRLYNRWREECDPLRKQISQQLEKEVIKERDQQVIERENARMADDEIENAYVEQVKKNVQEYNERMRQEELDYRMKQRRNKTTWMAQIGQRRDDLIREQQKDREEGLRFRRQNDEDIRRARQQAEQRRIDQEIRRKELDTINQDQITRRRALADAERELDLKYLQQAKDELRREQEDNMVKRILNNREANRNRQLLEMQLNRKKESDDLADRYIQQTVDEVNRRQDEAWRIDAEKRRNLLMDATRYQEYQMSEREAARRNAQLEKIEEGKRLEEVLEEKRRLDNEEREERLMKIRNQNQMLQNQVEYKRQADMRQRQEEKESVRSLLQQWADEEEKIKRELANPVPIGKRFRGFR
ncbi:hypothetical protein M9Y10_001528 [Tritrichomonas musculus]|uniref:Cilia- and flagella-associated protein 53 n=1 Tax=Tritrichomonas musculus TaxID=1915356 RepID=A0ABR2L844_9EUKA